MIPAQGSTWILDEMQNVNVVRAYCRPMMMVVPIIFWRFGGFLPGMLAFLALLVPDFCFCFRQGNRGPLD